MKKGPGGEAIEAVMGVYEGYSKELPATGGVHLLYDLSAGKGHIKSHYIPCMAGRWWWGGRQARRLLSGCPGGVSRPVVQEISESIL